MGFAVDVALAEQAMRELFPETPLQRNDYLSLRHGAEIWLKREDLSPVRSYKIRGAFNFFRKAMAQGKSGSAFVCASAGNHAQGFAFVCRHLGQSGVIFMPVTTPQQKIDKTRVFGGTFIEIRLVGDIFDQCNRAAIDFASASDAVMVPPFDHEDIVEGQASVGLEIARQFGADGPPDMIVVAVGGGGLSSGLVRYFSELDTPMPQFRFVEPVGAPSLRQSLEAGQRVKLETVDNFVDGAAVAQIGAIPFETLKRFSAKDVTLVPEGRLCATMIQMLNIEGMVLEPAGALAVDALKDIAPGTLAGKRIVCIASGGNFDFERLPDVKERALRFEGLKKYFVVRFPQRPGALRDFLEMLGPEDDISRFEYLKKSARNFGSVLIGIETRNPANFARLTARMNDAGVRFQDITDNEVLANLII
jgi:threonine dehydratase